MLRSCCIASRRPTITQHPPPPRPAVLVRRRDTTTTRTLVIIVRPSLRCSMNINWESLGRSSHVDAKRHHSSFSSTGGGGGGMMNPSSSLPWEANADPFGFEDDANESFDPSAATTTATTGGGLRARRSGGADSLPHIASSSSSPFQDNDEDHNDWRASLQDPFSSSSEFKPSPDDEGSRITNVITALDRLRCVAREELGKETERDMRQGVAALPPLVPKGWTRHSSDPQKRFFVLSKSWRPSSTSTMTASSSVSASPLEAEDDARQQTAASATTDFCGGRRQYRSKHKQSILNLVDPKSSLLRSGRPFPTYSSSASQSDPLARSHANTPFESVTIFAPFHTTDPSFDDHGVDLCEWTPLDVLVTKPRHRTSMVLYLSLASVNSETRIRSIQFLDPEVVEQRLGLSLATLPSTTAQPPSDSLLSLRPQPSSSLSSSSSLPSVSPALDLVARFGVEGAFYRRQLYSGPNFTQLSKEMQEEWRMYVESTLGIHRGVVEYVCQEAYMLEHAAYKDWLAGLEAFAGSS